VSKDPIVNYKVSFVPTVLLILCSDTLFRDIPVKLGDTKAPVRLFAFKIASCVKRLSVTGFLYAENVEGLESVTYKFIVTFG